MNPQEAGVKKTGELWRKALKEDGVYEHHAPGPKGVADAKRFSRIWKRVLGKLGKDRFPESVFEFGCGGGKHLSAFAFAGSRCVGLDVSNEVLRRAEVYKKELEGSSGQKLDMNFVNKDFFDFQTEEKFDLVFHVGVLEHFLEEETRMAALRKMFEITKPGGYVVSIVPSGMHPLRKKMRTEGLGGYDIPEIDYSDDIMRREFESCGSSKTIIMPHSMFGHFLITKESALVRILKKIAYLGFQIIPPQIMPKKFSLKKGFTLIGIAEKPAGRHLKVLASDLEESKWSLKKILILAKSIYYSLQRPLFHLFLRWRMRKLISEEQYAKSIDRFLWNEGGMFKTYVYSICNSQKSIRDSVILVPGCGYGHCILQLARFKPKKIIGFDLYEFRDEWKWVAAEAAKLGVETEFFVGDFDAVPRDLVGSFDFIISDAVLEHVMDMRKFARESYVYLKPGGIFYASYGPIWFGPGGDHIDWGKDFYNHLLLNREDYSQRINKFLSENESDTESCESYFLVRDDLFSKLKCFEYVETLGSAGFHSIKQFAKISSVALSAAEDPGISTALEKSGSPKFDRICAGIYLWMRK